MFDAQQQEVAIRNGVTVVIEVLGQLEGVTGQHGATVAAALKRLALYFHGFQSMTHQRLAIRGHRVAVMAGKVVDFVRRDLALDVEAGHADRQWISRLPVVECLNGHTTGLQNPVAAPLSDGIGCLGDRSTVVADLRLLR
ncbi:hypothetical protein D3C86_1350840 [compost metagenome]